MTTTKKLWLGFGTLTVVLVLVVVAIVLHLWALGGHVHKMGKARDRSVATRELEINVLGYAVHVHQYPGTGDPNALQEAAQDAAAVEQNLATYQSLATTDRHRDMAARFALMWREFKGLGQAVIDVENLQQSRQDKTKFYDLRRRLERFLDQDVQRAAVEEYDVRRQEVAQSVWNAVALAMILMAVGVCIAVVTSVSVGRGIVKTEGLLQEKAEELRITLISIGEGVVTTDYKGRVVLFNRMAEFLTGWTSYEAKGRPLEEVFRSINEQTRQPVKNPVETVLTTGQVVELANDSVLIAKDGTERPIEGTTAPIQDSEGKVLGAVLTVRDLSERKTLEAQLQQERLRIFRATIATVHDLVNNSLNNLQLLRMDAEESHALRPDSLELFDAIVHSTAKQLTLLGDVEEVVLHRRAGGLEAISYEGNQEPNQS